MKTVVIECHSLYYSRASRLAESLKLTYRPVVYTKGLDSGYCWAGTCEVEALLRAEVPVDSGTHTLAGMPRYCGIDVTVN